MGKGDVAALVRSRMNGLQPFESTTEQTTETMPIICHKTITAAAMTTNRITSLPELLHCQWEILTTFINANTKTDRPPNSYAKNTP